MVRVKERYLLVKILYPDGLGSRSDVPDVVLVNQPTTDELNSATLIKGIRAEVASLFGDYGSGSIEGGNLSGVQVLFRRYLDLHPTNLAILLSACMGRAHIYEFGTC
ncbi:hypothetical protein GGR52DRAFT_576414 [Hypoxylon sp. FL1284]|nr:hypothetical protein GGR52DRAFT_576414 [Hypoxylon sp. FL1284]